MPRAIWSGAISFGLVTIPCRLYPAVSRKGVRFNLLDERTGSRIRQKRVSAVDGEEVPSDHLVKGYELADGRYVTVTDDELDALDPDSSRTIDIEAFVDLVDIDPIYYDSAYYLSPDPVAAKAYALLTEAMERTRKVAVATFVMRTKQYVAAVRPKDGALVLSTMVYADEVNAVEGIDGLDAVAAVEVSDRELAMAEQLIGSLTEEFAPERFTDTYRERLLELIDRKAAGEPALVEAPAAPTADKVVDLMAALEASVAEAKAARTRHPSSAETAESGAGPADSSVDEDSAASRRTA